MRDLAAIWLYVADSSCRGYSPLYDRICRAVAESGYTHPHGSQLDWRTPSL